MTPQTQQTCADIAVQQLVGAGVTVCFANPGTTEMFIVSALEKQQQRIRSILCLHEAVCTGACDGYARIRGRSSSPAVALLHLGPGLGNGLCNLHNAHRAGSPVLVLVGDHATWHRAADPPLAQNIEALAGTVSSHVLSITSPDTVVITIQHALQLTQGASSSSSSRSLGGLTASGLAAAQTCPHSKVVTVVLPHDISWMHPPAPQQQTAGSTATTAVAAAAAAAAAAAQPIKHRLADSPAGRQFLSECAAALLKAPRGKVALVLGGAALLNEGGALSRAGRISAALGASLLCEALPARISRGAGLPHCTRLPYFPQEAATELAKYQVLLLLDIRRPVANFGYKDGPSQLLSQPDDNIWELDDDSFCVDEALELLADMLPGSQDITPGVNCGGRFAVAHSPALPSGPLNAAALCQAVAALQPAGTILVDESLTSGSAYWEDSKGCPAFDHLCLTGGAIGSGPPMAVGAAVAAPARQVINLQADGSAMYTLQALWTQAREKLKVITIICANNTYAILKVEAMRQRSGSHGALTSLAGPDINWVMLAAGMGVPAGRADTCEQLVELIKQGLQQQGPFLIHAALK